MRFYSFLLLAICSISASAAELPRGNAPGPGKKFEVLQTADALPSCHDYHMNPEVGDIAFDSAVGMAYFLGQEVVKDQSKAPKNLLIQLSLSNLTLKKLATISSKKDTKIVLHNNPAEAATLLSPRGGNTGCGQGTSKGVTVQWGGQRRIIKSFAKKYYKILKSSKGTQVFSIANRNVSAFDLGAFQRRTIKKLPKNGVPLYFDIENLVSYHFEDEADGQLLRYNVLSSKLEKKIKLAAGMKLVQQEHQFGVATVNDEEGLITVNQIKGWSGSRSKVFRFRPNKIDVGQSQLHMNFESGLAVLTGRNESISRSLGKLEIIDGKQSQILQIVKAPKNHFWSSVALSPNGQYFVLLARHLNDYSLGAISVYNLAQRKLQKVHMVFTN